MASLTSYLTVQVRKLSAGPPGSTANLTINPSEAPQGFTRQGSQLRSHDHDQAPEAPGPLASQARTNSTAPRPDPSMAAHLSLTPGYEPLPGSRAARGDRYPSLSGHGQSWSEVGTVVEPGSHDKATPHSADHSWLPCSPDGSPSPEDSAAFLSPALLPHSKGNGSDELGSTGRGRLTEVAPGMRSAALHAQAHSQAFDKASMDPHRLRGESLLPSSALLTSASARVSSSSSTLSSPPLEKGWCCVLCRACPGSCSRSYTHL